MENAQHSSKPIASNWSDYNARFYSPTLGRFTQPDTIVPDMTNTQAWNRYSYVNNSPIMYVDPSGHFAMLHFKNVMETDTGTGGSDSAGTSSSDSGSGNQPGNIDEDVIVIVCGLDIDLTNPAYGPGLSCDESMPGWVPYIDDRYEFRYQFGGKLATMNSILELGVLSPDMNLSLIGFSGGGDTALLLALHLVENGIVPDNLVLLGTTFEATVGYDANGLGIVRTGFSAWEPYIDTLVQAGVNVLVIGDSTITNPLVTPNYSGIEEYRTPADASGSFTYRDFPALQHATQTNTLDSFVTWVLSGLGDPNIWSDEMTTFP